MAVDTGTENREVAVPLGTDFMLVLGSEFGSIGTNVGSTKLQTMCFSDCLVKPTCVLVFFHPFTCSFSVYFLDKRNFCISSRLLQKSQNCLISTFVCTL